MADRPYIDYKFIGIRSFTELLNEHSREYRLFEEDGYHSLYERHKDILREDDRITSGVVIGDHEHLYFTDFALKITTSYHSHIVFLFDHHPLLRELDEITQNLEPLVDESLATLDLSVLQDPPGIKKGPGTEQ